MNQSRRKFLARSSQAMAAASAALSFPNVIVGRSLRSQNTRPNVLTICLEDISAERLACYGHPVTQTPNIDAFCETALRFDNCHVQVTMCVPSRTSIGIGLRPETTGFYGSGNKWLETYPGIVSMPRHFRNNGYNTYCVGKIWDPRCGTLDDPYVIQKEAWGVEKPHQIAHAMNMFDTINANRDKPWYYEIGFKSCHCHWTPPQEFLDRYDRKDCVPEGPAGLLKQCGWGLFEGDITYASGSNRLLTEEEAIDAVWHYYAELTWMDAQIGDMLTKARNLGLLENTIVTIWAGDHGYALGEGGRWDKTKLYHVDTHVPLMVRVPGHPSNGRSTAGLVEAVDWYPTLVDLCGLPRPTTHELDGFSMKGLLDNPSLEWKSAVFTHGFMNTNRAMKTSRYDIHFKEDFTPIELYDLEQDPKETTNILSGNQALAGTLIAQAREGWKGAEPSAVPTQAPAGGRASQYGPPSPGVSINGSRLSVDVSAGAVRSIRVADLQGRTVLASNPGHSHLSLDALSRGRYTVTIDGYSRSWKQTIMYTS